MSDDGPSNKIISGVKTVFELASETPELAEAGRTLARSALTISKAVENALLPIAAVNYGFDKARKYFEERFPKDMEEVTKEIPPEEVVEPKASVAAPALQGLAFSHEEPDLKSMYLNLLRTAMDGRKKESAHPAFSEVIRQLGAEEARIFNTLSGSRVPIVNLRQREDEGFNATRRDIISLMRDGEPVPLSQLAPMIDNWQRLGLVSISYRYALVGDERYAWVEARPEYVELQAGGKEIEVEKGMLELSSFGWSFKEAVS